MFAVRSPVIRHELRHLACKPPASLPRRAFTTSSRMDSAGTSATLYATVSTSATRAAEPEGREELKHHLKDGKGFLNPWPSYHDASALTILRQLLWYVFTLCWIRRVSTSRYRADIKLSLQAQDQRRNQLTRHNSSHCPSPKADLPPIPRN